MRQQGRFPRAGRDLFRYALAVQTERVIENLALIGFMGTGKSSAGHMAADQLGFRFIDTDHLIEERAGASITELFAHHGEAAFRDLERRVVQEMAGIKGAVISTGGGLGANAENLAMLKQHSIVICLWASAEAIFQRVGHQGHRPLLQCEQPLERIRELLSAREPVYRQADVLLNTEMRSAREIAHLVVHQFQLARQSQPAR